MIFKSKQALKEFLATCHPEDEIGEVYSDNGQWEGERIYRDKRGKLWSVDFYDQNPCERKQDGWTVSGEFEAFLVCREVELVESVRYNRINSAI